MLVLVKASEKAVLTALTAVGGLLTGAKLGLFQNDVNPGRATLLADLDPATFDGYALSAAITWSAPVLGEDGFWRVVGDAKTFISDDPQTTPNTIYGWYLVDAAGTGLIGAERYEEARLIFEPDQSIIEVPQVGSVSKYGS